MESGRFQYLLPISFGKPPNKWRDKQSGGVRVLYHILIARVFEDAKRF